MKKTLTALFLLIILSSGACLAEPPNDAKLIYNEGVELYKLGEYERAMEAFKKATELDPNYIDAYFNLGTVLEYLQQYNAALTVFKQIIVRKPDDYEAVYKAALLSVKTGENDNAKSYLSIIPRSAEVAPKAQQLAHQLQTDMQTIKKEEQTKETQEQKVPQSNNVFNDIPSPTGITSDNDGNVYVAGFSDNTIYKITPDGKKLVFLKDVRVNGPIGMVSDNSGNIYISNYNANNIIKIASDGAVTILLSNVQKPYGMHISGNILYISSQGSNAVIKYVL
ncbi:TPA: tetratricopeptide repeat protein [Candidatus Scatenecus faecavium]|uniref:Tetratricopeptide repeat protein n=1 Tax=Candidatus Scatenecus faecavium TaxID=2840915 RepID=A0A9D1FWJ1_9BACT|nr:tetratricopeptide repeat protein [Candidatus Scatenecus faecavium]